jgi:hypothetical protein
MAFRLTVLCVLRLNEFIMLFTACFTKSKSSDGPVDSINYVRNS